MIAFNYNRLLKFYDRDILYYAKRIDYYNYDDYAQEIRIYLYQNIDSYDIEKASLSSYAKLLILTSFRRLIFDKKKQNIFEDSHTYEYQDNLFTKEMLDDFDLFEDKNKYEDLVAKIILELKNETHVVIFYCVLYNGNHKNYKQIANFLNMGYPFFLYHVKQIKEVVKQVVIKSNKDI